MSIPPQRLRRHGLGLLLLATIAAGGGGCVLDRTGMSQTAQVEAEIRRTQDRVRALEDNLGRELDTTTQELTTVRRDSQLNQVNLANSDAVLREILDQNTGLRGSLESIQLRVADLEEGEERVQENLAFQIQEFERRLTNLESAAPAVLSDGASPQGAVASAAPRAPAEPLEGALKVADDALRAGDYKGALKALKGYKPKTDAEKETARLLYAEALYKDRQLSEALSAYQRFIESYPNSPRMPEAMLQLGTILVELEAGEDARFFFSELIRLYPDSPEAAKAKARQNAIKAKP